MCLDKGSGGGFQTQIVEDPYKTAVSNPLSAYLASDVGKGLPTYAGKLTADMPEAEVNNLNKYLTLDPNEWFNKNIQDPTMKNYQDNTKFLTDERFAGNLRGSGRFAGQESAVGSLSASLAAERGSVVPQIAGQQFDMASKYTELLNQNYQTQYKAWLQTLPEYNPALADALTFLNADSGYNVLSVYNEPDYSKRMAQISNISSLLGAGSSASFMGYGASSQKTTSSTPGTASTTSS